MLREQTTGEEIANTVTHVIGSHLGAAMLALLVWAGATLYREASVPDRRLAVGIEGETYCLSSFF